MKTKQKAPTGLLSILACLYWIMFFVHQAGVYPMHIFELIVALILTLTVGYIDLKD